MMAVNLKNDLRSSWTILENKLALKQLWSLKGRKNSREPTFCRKYNG